MKKAKKLFKEWASTILFMIGLLFTFYIGFTYLGWGSSEQCTGRFETNCTE